jgi:hypothetical protein
MRAPQHSLDAAIEYSDAGRAATSLAFHHADAGEFNAEAWWGVVESTGASGCRTYSPPIAYWKSQCASGNLTEKRNPWSPPCFGSGNRRKKLERVGPFREDSPTGLNEVAECNV